MAKLSFLGHRKTTSYSESYVISRKLRHIGKDTVLTIKCRSRVWVERAIVFYNTVSDVQQLPHGCTDYLHGCFAVFVQTTGELFDDFVIFHGGDRRKIKGLSYAAAAEF